MTIYTALTPAVVLVEDESEILTILQYLMRDLVGQYDILALQSGAEALAQLARRPVPLLITDYRMPGMDGLALIQAVRAASPRTRIVMITADQTPKIESRARAAGADHFLVKPFPLEHLRDIVHVTLGTGKSAP
jgi:two-component system, response regulator, stage 0 sporulation protein F